MNWFSKFLAATFLSAAVLVPPIVFAVTLAVYESARNDPAKQSKIFKGAYSTAVSSTVTDSDPRHLPMAE